MELLRRLNDCFAASGYEEEIREVVFEHLSHWYDVSVDALGNVIASKSGAGEHLAFLAPMDTGGVLLNYKKEDTSYYFVKLSPELKANLQDAKGRALDGTVGKFFYVSEQPEKSYFHAESELELPMIADVSVSFSVSEERITSRHAALYALLALAERLRAVSSPVTFVALAQTKLRQRGAYGHLPNDVDMHVLIEPLEVGKYHLGDGAIFSLKDGAYLCPERVFERFSAFQNRYVGEDKPSLAAVLSRQGNGRLVASLKIPVRGIGTANETFCLADVKDLCNKLSKLL